MILSSFWENIKEKENFSTFVFGPKDSTEVKLVKEYCNNFNINNFHYHLNDNYVSNIYNNFLKAALITDLEENIGNYIPIMLSNITKKEKGFQFSFNGLGGELYRDFWWIQEVFIKNRPANLQRLINHRMLQYEFTDTIFTKKYLQYIAKITSSIEDDFFESIKDMDLNNTPNTLQIDNLYFRQKMRKWAGRTISSSNQLISIVSPLLFKKNVEIALKLSPKFKRNGNLSKSIIQRNSKQLASKRMLNGEPCEIMRFSNIYKFYPIIINNNKRLIRKISQHMLGKTILIDRSLSYGKNGLYDKLFDGNNSDIFHFDFDNLYNYHIIHKERFKEYLKYLYKGKFTFLNQLENLMTLETRIKIDNKQIEIK